MASEFVGLSRGQTQFQCVFGTSTQSTDVEIRFDKTKFSPNGGTPGTAGNGTLGELLLVIDEIKRFIQTDAAKAGSAGLFG